MRNDELLKYFLRNPTVPNGHCQFLCYELKKKKGTRHLLPKPTMPTRFNLMSKKKPTSPITKTRNAHSFWFDDKKKNEMPATHTPDHTKNPCNDCPFPF